MRVPLLRPNPPRLSERVADLVAIEESGIFSNYGPVNSRFETAARDGFFGGSGHCLTVNNATIGLMMALKECAPDTRRRPYAIMPAFTFAATAHAALWAGLTPIFCDIDPRTWLPCEAAEMELIERYSDKIGVLVPYATFGNCLDLARYEAFEDRFGIPTVIDAAASLGSRDAAGLGFGANCRFATVFSMHVTKTFSTAEAGLIYASDAQRIQRLRVMGNFGFGEPRCATMPGLNSKLSEIGASLALSKLAGFERIVAHRSALAEVYRSELPDTWTFQMVEGSEIAYQFMPALLPESMAKQRDEIVRCLLDNGIGSGKYFSPHLFEQPYFRETCLTGDLSVTSDVASRAISLPLWDAMGAADVRDVCAIVKSVTGSF